jgi:ribosomal protein L7/L12
VNDIPRPISAALLPSPGRNRLPRLVAQKTDTSPAVGRLPSADCRLPTAAASGTQHVIARNGARRSRYSTAQSEAISIRCRLVAAPSSAAERAVIKKVRALTSPGLKEAKDLVDGAPKPLLERISKETADKARAALEDAGATGTVN